MKKLLTHIAQNFQKAIEGNNTDAKNYLNMREHAGWKTHLALLALIRNDIMQTILSPEFTELDSKEKDIKQRAYANVDLMLMFLMSPVKQAEQYVKLMRHNKNMEATIKGSDRKGTKT